MSRSSAFFNPPSADITIHVSVLARWWIPKADASDRRSTILVGLVQDEHGTVVAHFQNVNFWHARDEGLETSGYVREEAAYNLLTLLKPGRYQFKIAVADLDGGIAGSRTLLFEVPQHIAPKVVASSVVLSDRWITGALEKGQKETDTSANPGDQTTLIFSEATRDPLKMGDRSLAPSVDRIFPDDAQITIFLRLYPEIQEGPPQGWKVTASLLDSAEKRIISEAPADVLGSEIGVPGIPVLYTFDLAKLKLQVGKYLAQINVIPSGQKQSMHFAAEFIVAARNQ
jgi:hypothetical protein